MDQAIQQRFHEAVLKANAASADNVRLAYLDLAHFYQRKLDDRAGISERSSGYCLI